MNQLTDQQINQLTKENDNKNIYFQSFSGEYLFSVR